MNRYGKAIENAKIKDYTTYKLSGTIKKVIYPNTKEELISLINHLKKTDQKYLVVGNGSNLIFTKSYNGTVIKLDNFNNLTINSNIVTVGAGYNLVKLALKTAHKDLTGLEFAQAIPATVGGAIYMNAGAYKSQMSDIVKEILILDENLKLKTLTKNEINFSYRSSILRKKDYICLEATLELKSGNKEKSLELIKDRKQRRLSSQPLNYPSAGSVFQNPANDYAGRLIEKANLKGKQIGDAQISKKHANFIINKGNASGKDVQKLIYMIQKEIQNKYGITLKIEQEFIE